MKKTVFPAIKAVIVMVMASCQDATEGKQQIADTTTVSPVMPKPLKETVLTARRAKSVNPRLRYPDLQRRQ